jgi:hypothetical protein
MKCMVTLLKAFLAISIAFAFTTTLEKIEVANAGILTVVSSVGNPDLATPPGPLVPAIPFYSPKKFPVPGEASEVSDSRESVEAMKAWLLRAIVKDQGLDWIWTETWKEESGGPVIRGEDLITILQKNDDLLR